MVQMYKAKVESAKRVSRTITGKQRSRRRESCREDGLNHQTGSGNRRVGREKTPGDSIQVDAARTRAQGLDLPKTTYDLGIEQTLARETGPSAEAPHRLARKRGPTLLSGQHFVGSTIHGPIVLSALSIRLKVNLCSKIVLIWELESRRRAGNAGEKALTTFVWRTNRTILILPPRTSRTYTGRRRVPGYPTVGMQQEILKDDFNVVLEDYMPSLAHWSISRVESLQVDAGPEGNKQEQSRVSGNGNDRQDNADTGVTKASFASRPYRPQSRRKRPESSADADKPGMGKVPAQMKPPRIARLLLQTCLEVHEISF
ncbi:hypothetical protein B0H12DRAFT_1081337 [Mycena haematopus]|nr:hypothetical protein B0H12DRAFT_1081337 [Mycena haematopus]